MPLATWQDLQRICKNSEDAYIVPTDTGIRWWASADQETFLAHGAPVLFWKQGSDFEGRHTLMMDLERECLYVVDEAQVPEGGSSSSGVVATVKLWAIDRILSKDEAITACKQLNVEDRHLTPETALVVVFDEAGHKPSGRAEVKAETTWVFITTPQMQVHSSLEQLLDEASKGNPASSSVPMEDSGNALESAEVVAPELMLSGQPVVFRLNFTAGPGAAAEVQAPAPGNEEPWSDDLCASQSLDSVSRSHLVFIAQEAASLQALMSSPGMSSLFLDLVQAPPSEVLSQDVQQMDKAVAASFPPPGSTVDCTARALLLAAQLAVQLEKQFDLLSKSAKTQGVEIPVVAPSYDSGVPAAPASNGVPAPSPAAPGPAAQQAQASASSGRDGRRFSPVAPPPAPDAAGAAPSQVGTVKADAKAQPRPLRVGDRVHLQPGVPIDREDNVLLVHKVGTVREVAGGRCKVHVDANDSSGWYEERELALDDDEGGGGVCGSRRDGDPCAGALQACKMQ
mmetsp:Transcript_72752/g.194151  ORF Transcript_72752/g.194151 Transcript_72752/m.194151 type:complete len:511 (-) Transcript_72752:90-1622(-)